MRHLFDQYDGIENRVTHALACCLAEDRKLLGRFIEWSISQDPPPPDRLYVLEQQLPGGPIVSEREAAQGLPDICVHDDAAWCLIIENKLGTALSPDQLSRHRATLKSRGFEPIYVLAIAPVEPAPSAVDAQHHLRWAEVYRWSQQQARSSEWARRLAEYLEVVDVRMDEEGRERGWSLTTFTGIPFGTGEPYDYGQAKRLLRVAMEELRPRPDLRSQLGIYPQDIGRGKITGRAADGVWDTLRLKAPAPLDLPVQSVPHLTLAIGQQGVLAILVLPNGLRTEFRERVRDLGLEGFVNLAQEVARNMSQSLAAVAGWVPWIEVVQRHYPSRSADAVIDAELGLDIRTTLVDGGSRGSRRVKPQPLWAHTAFMAFAGRRGTNTQLAIGARFPYAHCRAVSTPELLDHIAAAWIACKPVTDLLVGRGPQNAKSG
jgi:hypothetical protein